MHTVSGGCHCGNILVDMTITAAPDNCHPRACDCDFCRKHGAAYVSDPNGSLLIRIKNAHQTSRYRQGNGLADFLLCTTCGVLVGVLFQGDGQLHATVNVKAIEATTTFGSERPVSPKTLSGDQKTKRWQDVWFRNVEIRG
jgi:hypothetical protein